MTGITIVRGRNIGKITISRPQKRNAMDNSAINQMIKHLGDLRYDDNIRSVVITGEGDAFCAGADISDHDDIANNGSNDSASDMIVSIEQRFHEIIRTLMRMRKPVIAKIRGPAVGAGACIATACDFVYASPDAKLGWTFSNIGLGLDSATSFILPRLVGMRDATELVIGGDLIDAEEAAELGLINEVIQSKELDDHVEEHAAELAQGPTRAYGEIKRMLLRGNHQSLEQTLDSEAMAQSLLFQSHDRQEGRDAFREGRRPNFEGR